MSRKPKTVAAQPVAPHAGIAPRPASGTVTQGVLLFVGFALIGPFIDVFAKLATDEVPAAQITFGRFVVQTALLLPIVIFRRALVAMPWREAGLHALRGVLMAVATVFFFAALKHMPIADAIAIFFVEPLILTLLGGLILGEPVGWRRYAACAVGFVGALIVIQPSFAELGWVSALPLGTAFCFAFYLILTRTLALRTDAFAMQAYSGVSGALFIGAVLLLFSGSGDATFDPIWPSERALWLLLGVGVAATVAHLLVVYAFRAAPASVLAPLQYLEIVSATAFGWFVFGDFPNAMKWLGIAIIVGSGLFIIARERKAARGA
ncbi:MAG: DMT family transporter [Pseudomonadota bacterium]